LTEEHRGKKGGEEKFQHTLNEKKGRGETPQRRRDIKKKKQKLELRISM